MMKETDFFACLYCGSTEVEPSEARWVCRNCRREYPVQHGIPLLVKDWSVHQSELDRLAQIKPDWYRTQQDPEETSPWRHNHRKRRLYVQERIRKWLDEKSLERVNRLLDLGCGDGNHLAYLKDFGRSIYGSDYNLIRLVRSNLRFPDGAFFLADILDYPARDDFFDLIFFNHVIEHITDDAKALKTVARILKPGGLLILGTPNEGAAWWQLAYRLQPSMRRETDHVQFYTVESLASRMTAAGLKILETRHIGWGPPHFTLDSKIRRYRIVDDTFEILGKRFFPRQASSLYILATRE